MRIVGISSGGGHLTELITVIEHLPPLIAVITEKGAVSRNSDSSLPLQPIKDPHRSPIGFIINTMQAFRYVFHYKPDVVISTGAGMTVPFFLIARVSGASCIYIETGARISTPSMTGRLLYHFASLFIIQSKGLLPYCKKSVVSSII